MGRPKRQAKNRGGDGRGNRRVTTCSSVLTEETDTAAVSRLNVSRQKSAQKSANTANALYLAIVNRKQSLTVVVMDWLGDYKVDQERATFNLAQMIFCICGCENMLTRDQWANADEEMPGIIKQMSKSLLKEPGAYLLSESPEKTKQVATALDMLFTEIIRQMRNSLLYDGYLLSKMLVLISCLSDSQIRAFRHTATYIGLKLTTALVATLVEAKKCVCTLETQLEAAQSDNNTSRMERLAVTVTEMKDNINELDNMIMCLRTSIFVKRCRDTMVEIRVLTCKEAGVWMMKLPGTCRNFLKYIKLGMIDPIYQVRQTALEVVESLMASEHVKVNMGMFLNSVKQILLEMILSKEISEAVHAINILCNIQANNEDCRLEVKDIESVCGFVFSKSQAIANAAGRFLWLCLRKDDHGSNLSSQRTLLKQLMEYHQIVKLSNDYIPLLVSVLYDIPDCALMFTNWNLLTESLMDDDETMEIEEEAILIKITASAVKRATCGLLFHKAAKEPSQRELAVREKKRSRITAHFMEIMPVLLNMHDNAENLKELLSIVNQMDIAMYGKARKEAILNKLVKAIAKIIMRSIDEEVLNMGTRLLMNIKRHTDQACLGTITLLQENAMVKFTDACQSWVGNEQTSEETSEDDNCKLLNSLRVLAIMGQGFNVFNAENFSLLFNILRTYVQKDGIKLAEDAYRYAVTASYYSMLFCAMESSVVDMKTIKKEYLVLFCQILELSASTAVKLQAFRCTCDCLIIFFGDLKNSPFIRDTVGKLGILLKSLILEHEHEDEESCLPLIVQYWKLLHKGFGEPEMSYIYFSDYLQMEAIYQDAIKNVYVYAWRDYPKMCAFDIVLGLMKVFVDAEAIDGEEEKQEALMRLKKVALICSSWLSTGVNNDRSCALSEAFHEVLVYCATVPGIIPYLEVLASFTAILNIKTRQLLARQLPDKSHKSVKILLAALKSVKPTSEARTVPETLKRKTPARFVPLDVTVVPQRRSSRVANPTRSIHSSAVIESDSDSSPGPTRFRRVPLACSTFVGIDEDDGTLERHSCTSSPQQNDSSKPQESIRSYSHDFTNISTLIDTTAESSDVNRFDDNNSKISHVHAVNKYSSKEVNTSNLHSSHVLHQKEMSQASSASNSEDETLKQNITGESPVGLSSLGSRDFRTEKQQFKSTTSRIVTEQRIPTEILETDEDTSDEDVSVETKDPRKPVREIKSPACSNIVQKKNVPSVTTSDGETSEQGKGDAIVTTVRQYSLKCKDPRKQVRKLKSSSPIIIVRKKKAPSVTDLDDEISDEGNAVVTTTCQDNLRCKDPRKQARQLKLSAPIIIARKKKAPSVTDSDDEILDQGKGDAIDTTLRQDNSGRKDPRTQARQSKSPGSNIVVWKKKAPSVTDSDDEILGQGKGDAVITTICQDSLRCKDPRKQVQQLKSSASSIVVQKKNAQSDTDSDDEISDQGDAVETTVSQGNLRHKDPRKQVRQLKSSASSIVVQKNTSSVTDSDDEISEQGKGDAVQTTICQDGLRCKDPRKQVQQLRSSASSIVVRKKKAPSVTDSDDEISDQDEGDSVITTISRDSSRCNDPRNQARQSKSPGSSIVAQKKKAPSVTESDDETSEQGEGDAIDTTVLQYNLRRKDPRKQARQLKSSAPIIIVRKKKAPSVTDSDDEISDQGDAVETTVSLGNLRHKDPRKQVRQLKSSASSIVVQKNSSSVTDSDNEISEQGKGDAVQTTICQDNLRHEDSRKKVQQSTNVDPDKDIVEIELPTRQVSKHRGIPQKIPNNQKDSLKLSESNVIVGQKSKANPNLVQLVTCDSKVPIREIKNELESLPSSPGVTVQSSGDEVEDVNHDFTAVHEASSVNISVTSTQRIEEFSSSDTNGIHCTSLCLQSVVPLRPVTSPKVSSQDDTTQESLNHDVKYQEEFGIPGTSIISSPITHISASNFSVSNSRNSSKLSSVNSDDDDYTSALEEIVVTSPAGKSSVEDFQKIAVNPSSSESSYVSYASNPVDSHGSDPTQNFSLKRSRIPVSNVSSLQNSTVCSSDDGEDENDERDHSNNHSPKEMSSRIPTPLFSALPSNLSSQQGSPTGSIKDLYFCARQTSDTLRENSDSDDNIGSFTSPSKKVKLEPLSKQCSPTKSPSWSANLQDFSQFTCDQSDPMMDLSNLPSPIKDYSPPESLKGFVVDDVMDQVRQSLTGNNELTDYDEMEVGSSTRPDVNGSGLASDQWIIGSDLGALNSEARSEFKAESIPESLKSTFFKASSKSRSGNSEEDGRSSQTGQSLQDGEIPSEYDELSALLEETASEDSE